MSNADIEEISSKIAQLGETIKQAKAEKKPKEDWEPALQEMLALKVSNVFFVFPLQSFFCRNHLT
jgi:hypothetical protein